MTGPSSDDPVTTVKVPRSLRARIARDAAACGQTAAGFLTTVVDRWEREQRMTEVRRAYEQGDDSYREEVNFWDASNGDGTDG